MMHALLEHRRTAARHMVKIHKTEPQVCTCVASGFLGIRRLEVVVLILVHEVLVILLLCVEWPVSILMCWRSTVDFDWKAGQQNSAGS